jgi:hypothetical protein
MLVSLPWQQRFCEHIRVTYMNIASLVISKMGTITGVKLDGDRKSQMGLETSVPNK